MRCYKYNLHTISAYLFTLIRVMACFRSEEAEGKLAGEIPFARAIEMTEGNGNTVMGQAEFKRSIQEDQSYTSPKLVYENYMQNDLMAIPTPAKLREKRSKHSTKRSSIQKRSEVDTKDELMNILGTIHSAKHHRLSRKDIRKLARKAFAKLKMKKKDGKSQEKSETTKKKPVEKKVESKSKEEHSDAPKDEEKAEPDVEKTEPDTPKISKKAEEKSRKEDEKAFANMFEDSSKPKASELSEDITKLESNKKASDVISDDQMSKKSSKVEGANIETLFEGSTAPTEAPVSAKTTAKLIEQELNSEFSMKEKANPDLADKPSEKVAKKNEVKAKKSDIPDAKQRDKIKTLRALLAKANKSKVPKKFLGTFPAGLRMIAWRELLEKKKKELTALENSQDSENTAKKDDSTAQDSHPLTIDINIDPTGDKAAKISAKKDLGQELGVKSAKQSNTHHLASHVKYLQKHLAGVQDLRKLISRALIGHCKATGKRILKAFIAMDRALTRAQNIATVIGKKFKVDGSKIENIVVHKEDEVVESFLRDIFANFN